MDYLAVTTESWVTIVLGGEEIKVARARFGVHCRLMRMLQTKGDLDPIEFVRLATGFTENKLDEASPAELRDSFLQLVDLNRSRDTLPFMHAAAGKGDSWDYEGREIARVVHMLARTYNWTRSYILNELYAEEIYCYLQEILLDDYNEKEFQYSLSEVGFDKKGKKKPFPSLRWGKQAEAKEYPQIKKEVAERLGLVPIGNVIDLQAEYAKRRAKNDAQ